MKSQAIKLSDIANNPRLPMVELPSGRQVQLHAVNGICVALMSEYETTGNASLIWKCVAELIPDATKEEVSQLTMDHCVAVTQMASGQANALIAELDSKSASKPAVARPKSAAKRSARKLQAVSEE